MQGTKRVPAEMLEKMKPLFKERAKALVKEAFEIAAFLEDPKMLEEIWEELASDFDDSLEETPQPAMSEFMEQHDIGAEKHEVEELPGDGVNLVTGKALIQQPVRRKRKNVRRNRRARINELRRTHRTSRTGRPISQYNGVCWAEGRLPWRARYSGVDLGRYASEEEAAHAYDAYVFKRTRSLARINFPERYLQQARQQNR